MVGMQFIIICMTSLSACGERGEKVKVKVVDLYSAST